MLRGRGIFAISSISSGKRDLKPYQAPSRRGMTALEVGTPISNTQPHPRCGVVALRMENPALVSWKTFHPVAHSLLRATGRVSSSMHMVEIQLSRVVALSTRSASWSNW